MLQSSWLKADLHKRNIKSPSIKLSEKNWSAENHIQTAFSKLSVKKPERIWEGWEAKREHVETIICCRRDLLAFGLLGASTLLIHFKPVSTIKQPYNTASSTDYETVRSFIMLLSLCMFGWEKEKNCESWLQWWLVCRNQRENYTWNFNVECGELDTTSGRGQEGIDIVRLCGMLEMHK